MLASELIAAMKKRKIILNCLKSIDLKLPPHMDDSHYGMRTYDFLMIDAGLGNFSRAYNLALQQYQIASCTGALLQKRMD